MIASAHAWTILIVEPSAQDRDMLRAALEANPRQAYRVVEAESGTQGVAFCRRNQVDCVLLSFVLPDMHGLTFLGTLQGDQGEFASPVIMLIRAEQRTEALQALRRGAAYLVKGQFSPAVLHRAIARARGSVALLHETEAQRQQLKQANNALREQLALHAAVHETIDTGIALLDMHGTFISVNPAFGTIYGYQWHDLVGQPFLGIVPPDWRDEGQTLLTDMVAGASKRSGEWYGLRKDGSQFDVQMSLGRLLRDNGTCLIIVTVRDMTLQKQIEHALRESEERYRSVIDILSEGVMLQAADGRIVACNRSAERILGVPVDEMIDRVLDPSEWYTFYEDGSPFPPAAFPAQVTLRTGVPQKNVMMGIHRQDGPLAWILINTQPLVQAGVHTPYAVVVSFTDISERKQREERLRHLAFHDTLTNLPNRAMFMNRLRQALQHTRDYPDELFAVILFDLDHFKVINDSLGHPVGDLLLGTTAQRLEFCMREGDIIARLGGDEFAVLIEDILSPNDAIEVAERIQQTLNEPMDLDGYTIFTSASIGIVVNYSDVSAYRYEHPEDVLRDADTAMYRAKERGRAGYAMFDGEMRSQAIERLAIGTGLRQALARNELRLLYQPIVDLTSGEVVSLEALLHWNHPQRGLLSSEAFIGVANESGLIVSLGQWVLRETCRQIRAWMNEDALRMRQANQAPIAVNINISSHEFLYPSFVDEIRHALEAHSLDAHFLRLEIAESIVMYPTESLMPTLNQLHDLGVQLCLDGFGKGYLSLQHIAHFLIPMLKMDRSLVHTMHKDEKSLPIIQAIVMLAHTLEMDVVAVEVETEQQLARLKEMGCNFGQGFLFSRPVSAHTAAMLLRSEALHMISRAS